MRDSMFSSSYSAFSTWLSVWKSDWSTGHYPKILLTTLRDWTVGDLSLLFTAFPFPEEQMKPSVKRIRQCGIFISELCSIVFWYKPTFWNILCFFSISARNPAGQTSHFFQRISFDAISLEKGTCIRFHLLALVSILYMLELCSVYEYRDLWDTWFGSSKLLIDILLSPVVYPVFIVQDWSYN